MTAGKRDYREQLDVGPEQPAPELAGDDPPWMRLLGPNQWPADLPDFKNRVQAYDAGMAALARKFTQLLASALGMPENGLDKYFDTIICSDDTVEGKDAIEPYELAASNLGVDRTKCLFFDDGDIGLKGAAKAGIPYRCFPITIL